MPYKGYKSRESKADEGFSKEENIYYTSKFEKYLELKRKTIGIKLLFTEEEYNKYDCEECKYKMSYCVMIEKGTRGKFWKSTVKNHICDGATIALGMETCSEEIESGKTYFSYNLYKSPSIARRMYRNVISLHREPVKTYGIVTGPLECFEEEPDIVIVVTNPLQTMKIVQGNTYSSGVHPKLHYGSMQAFCSELTVYPYVTGEINISTLCPSTRTLAKWSENEMGVSIPFEKFYSIVDGICSIYDEKMGDH